jgi:formylglycine-generating enzyme required for sulfatase activity
LQFTSQGENVVDLLNWDEMVDIPEGQFIMGSDIGTEAEKPQHSISLRAFRMARYPVTNRQFLRFIRDQGYRNPDLWVPDGWSWCSQMKIDLPALWTHSLYNRPEQPVVGISWYEAAAYACWWSRQTGCLFHLPTEAQWERCARGIEGRLWPWGNKFEPNRCNTVESKFGKPTAVNAFPNGATPEGIFDLAGNVWEWCRTRWGRFWQTMEYIYPYQLTDDRDNDNEGRYVRIMRGGSWFDAALAAGMATRRRYLPDARSNNIGFRLVEELT